VVGHSTGIRWRGIAVLLGAAVLAALLAVGPVHGAGGGAPLAEAGLDQQVLRGETVRLDATGSYDPDGRVVAHEWRVRTPGGRTVTPSSPRAPRSSFRAAAVGRYEVTLTVTDGDGNTGTDTMYVVVEPGDGRDGTTGPATGGSGLSGSTSGGGDTDTGGGTGSILCSGTAGSSGGCATRRDTPLPEPAVSIEGPTVVEAERSYTYTARTSGLTAERSYDWEGGDTGRSHTLIFETGGAYTTRVAVEGARGRSAGAKLEVVVEPVDNQRPEVEIADPGSISPGQRLTLSADADDPDGRVVSTAWSPGRQVTVPTDGSSRTVRVTVTDEDGASVTDSITLTGVSWNRTEVGVDTTDVTCYFTKERHRDGRHPYSPRCVRENGNTVSLNVAASHIEGFRRNEKIDLHWRRTTESRLRGLRANDTSTDYGTAAASPHDEADIYGFSDDPVRRHTSARRATVDNVEAFTIDGRTVEDDLDGDGAVNAADWDQRYRTEEDTADVDPHADAVGALKRTVRGDGNPDGGSGGLDSRRKATARTVEGTFAGTSIDAEVGRDRIAEYSRRVSGGSGSDSGEADRSGGPDGPDGSETDRGGHDDGDADSGSGSGSAREVNDVNDRDDDDGGGTHSSGGNERNDGDDGDDGGSDADERSRHSPHGGRFVGYI
jgi:hypothetical protein